jgi:hypothetical protein
MFHNDSLECKTFTLASATEVYHVEIDHELLKGMRPRIELAIAFGKCYINVKADKVVYKGRYFDDVILEVSWD